MTTKWRINVDQINVGQGDAALWCIYGTDDGPEAVEELKKAILIDSGKKLNPLAFLRIFEIRLKNKIPGPPSAPRETKNKTLDLIIVTHNDDDHYDTIRNLLDGSRGSGDFQNYLDKNKTKFIDQGLGYKVGARLAKPDDAILAGKYLLYDLLDLTNCSYEETRRRILGRELLWWEPAIDITLLPDMHDGVTKESAEGKQILNLQKIYVKGSSPDIEGITVYFRKGDEVVTSSISDIRITDTIDDIAKEIIRKKIKDSNGEVYDLASLIDADGKLVGKKDPTLVNLSDANPISKGMPALFCTGIADQIINNPVLAKLAEKDEKKTNEGSIALLLVSPDNEILYYSAGDLTGDQSEDGKTIEKPDGTKVTNPLGNEQKVARWFNEIAYPATIPPEKRRVLVHKISHHGSKSSTPIELLQATKPKYTVISSGKTSHGLPDIGVPLSIYYSLTLSYKQKFDIDRDIGKIKDATSVNFPTMQVATNAPYYLSSVFRESETEESLLFLNTVLNPGAALERHYSLFSQPRQDDLKLRLASLNGSLLDEIKNEIKADFRGFDILVAAKNPGYYLNFVRNDEDKTDVDNEEVWKLALKKYWASSGFPDSIDVYNEETYDTLEYQTFSLKKIGDNWGIPEGVQSSIDVTVLGHPYRLQNLLDPDTANAAAQTAKTQAAAAAEAAETAARVAATAAAGAAKEYARVANEAAKIADNAAKAARRAAFQVDAYAAEAADKADVAASAAEAGNTSNWVIAAKAVANAAAEARWQADYGLKLRDDANNWRDAINLTRSGVVFATRSIAETADKAVNKAQVAAKAANKAKKTAAAKAATDAAGAAEDAAQAARDAADALVEASSLEDILKVIILANTALTSAGEADIAADAAHKAVLVRGRDPDPGMVLGTSAKRSTSKLPPLFSALSLESSPIAGIAASNFSGTGNYQRLTANCDLDNFLQLLPGKALDLTAVEMPEMPPAAQQMMLNGTVAGDLDDWFYNFDLSLSVELSGTIDGNNQLSVASEGAIFTLNTLSSALGAAASFRASLSVDGLSFALNTVNLRPSLLTNMDFCHYIYGSSAAVANVLSVLAGTGDNLAFPLSGALTEITFDPMDYSTRIELASQLPSITLFDKITLNPILLSFAATSRPIDDNFLRTSSSCYFNADLTIALSKNFETTIKGILYNDGAASFAISPGDENATLDFLDEFVSLFKDISIKEACAKLGLTELNLLKHIVFDFNVLPTPTLRSVSVSSEMVWTIKEGVTIDLLLNFSLSDSLSIYGSLDMSTAPSGQDLLAAHGIEAPEALSKSNSSVANLAFFAAQFSAIPSSKFYSLDLSLGTEEEPLFKFNDEIVFESLGLSLSSANGVPSASISAMVELARSNFSVTADYNNGKWIFSASIYLIPLSDITTLFIKEITGANISLPEIDLANLEVTFDLANKTFDFSGSLLLGSQTFNVSADTSQGTGGSHKLMSATWTANPNTPFGLSDLVAEFGKVMDLNLVLPKALSLNLQSAGLYYLMDKTTVGSVDTASHRVMGFELELASSALDLKGQFLLYAFEQAAAEPAPGADAGDETPATPAVGLESVVNIKATFPASLSLPLVGNVSLPIKSVEIFFVSQDLTEQKLGQINGVIPYINGENDENGKLWPLNLAGTNANSADGNAVVLTQGMHYQVNLSPSLAGLNLPMFDFNDAPAAAATSASLDTPTPASSSSTPSPIHWVKIDQGLGPIHLNRIGFGYQSGSILFSLDADLLLGGLTIGLDGLSMALPLNKLSDPSFSLNGLSLDYVLGDMELGGGFLKQIPPPSGELEHYAGEAVLKNEFLTLSAMGSYSKLSDDHISLFIFGMSQEPLGGPPAFYVTGFAGGFGYNQHLRLPSQDEVVNFPLVQGSSKPAVLNSGGSDLMSVLNTLEAGTNAWLTPQLNENWLAVGLDFSSFELIQSKALLVAQFGQDFELALLGRSWMQLPPEGEAIAYVEMGLEALFEPSQGFFGLTAVLSPNSFVFSRDCHLTGGFAFYLWFGGEHKGDFVVTLGGYHPNFVVPSHYPNEPRLGFNWQVSDDLVISGSAYFALTPSCVMGGGQLSADFSRGDLHAWFREYADFLIHWAPFEYEVDIGIDMGVSYRLNLLFTHVTLEVSLGADLTLWGPPLGGEAHVHWSVISFTVGFGQGRQEVKPMSWDEFQKKLPAAKNTSSSTTQGLSSKLLLSSGLLREEKEDNKPSVWVVRPDEFAFQTEALLPFTSFNFKVEEDEQKNTFSNQELWKDETTVDIRPMKLENLKLTHTLSITTKIPTQSSNSVSQMLSAAPPKAIDFWQVSVLDRKMPAALFGQPIDGAPSPSADCVDAYVGVELKPKTQQPGPNSGVLSLTALQQDGDRVQLSPADDEDNTNGYLNTAVEVLESLYQYGSDTNDEKEKKEQEQEARNLLASGLASDNSKEARFLLFRELKELGYLKSITDNGALSSMENLAKHASTRWSETPSFMQDSSSTQKLKLKKG